MRKMETLLLLSPELSVEERETVLKTMDEVIAREGGKVLVMEQWGMRGLACPVRKQMRGYSVRMEDAAPSKLVAELERIIRITDGIFKFMTVKLADSVEAAEEVA
ncbi:MAG: 30S ribosomal protein S6 [Mailhella sp.]|nr:30S ribosomal protein S6 [Mailhella sp.]